MLVRKKFQLMRQQRHDTCQKPAPLFLSYMLKKLNIRRLKCCFISSFGQLSMQVEHEDNVSLRVHGLVLHYNSPAKKHYSEK